MGLGHERDTRRQRGDVPAQPEHLRRRRSRGASLSSASSAGLIAHSPLLGQVSILDALTALNLTALTAGGPPPTSHRSTSHTFSASRIVPFATHFELQVLECAPSVPTRQVRFVVNDAVVPLHGSFAGCREDPNGLCAYDTVLDALIKRRDEIDFDYACNGNCASPPSARVFASRPLRTRECPLTRCSPCRLCADVRRHQRRASSARLEDALSLLRCRHCLDSLTAPSVPLLSLSD